MRPQGLSGTLGPLILKVKLSSSTIFHGELILALSVRIYLVVVDIYIVDCRLYTSRGSGGATLCHRDLPTPTIFEKINGKLLYLSL